MYSAHFNVNRTNYTSINPVRFSTLSRGKEYKVKSTIIHGQTGKQIINDDMFRFTTLEQQLTAFRHELTTEWNRLVVKLYMTWNEDRFANNSMLLNYQFRLYADRTFGSLIYTTHDVELELIRPYQDPSSSDSKMRMYTFSIDNIEPERPSNYRFLSVSVNIGPHIYYSPQLFDLNPLNFFQLPAPPLNNMFKYDTYQVNYVPDSSRMKFYITFDNLDWNTSYREDYLIARYYSDTIFQFYLILHVVNSGNEWSPGPYWTLGQSTIYNVDTLFPKMIDAPDVYLQYGNRFKLAILDPHRREIYEPFIYLQKILIPHLHTQYPNVMDLVSYDARYHTTLPYNIKFRMDLKSYEADTGFLSLPIYSDNILYYLSDSTTNHFVTDARIYQVGDRESTIYELDLVIPVGSFFEDKLYQVSFNWNAGLNRTIIGLTQDTNVVFQQHFFFSLAIYEPDPRDIEPPVNHGDTFNVTVNVNH